MSPGKLLDDRTIEAIVRGERVDGPGASLAGFAEQARAAGDEPPPARSAALQALIGDGEGHRAGWGGAPGGRVVALTGKVAALGLAAQVAIGASVAAAGVIGGGAAGVLPDRVNDGVRDAIEVVTPVEFPPSTEMPPDVGERAPDGRPGDTRGAPPVTAPPVAEPPSTTTSTVPPGAGAPGTGDVGRAVPDPPPGPGAPDAGVPVAPDADASGATPPAASAARPAPTADPGPHGDMGGPSQTTGGGAGETSDAPAVPGGSGGPGGPGVGDSPDAGAQGAGAPAGPGRIHGGAGSSGPADRGRGPGGRGSP